MQDLHFPLVASSSATCKYIFGPPHVVAKQPKRFAPAPLVLVSGGSSHPAMACSDVGTRECMKMYSVLSQEVKYTLQARGVDTIARVARSAAPIYVDTSGDRRERVEFEQVFADAMAEVCKNCGMAQGGRADIIDYFLFCQSVVARNAKQKDDIAKLGVIPGALEDVTRLEFVEHSLEYMDTRREDLGAARGCQTLGEDMPAQSMGHIRDPQTQTAALPGARASPCFVATVGQAAQRHLTDQSQRVGFRVDLATIQRAHVGHHHQIGPHDGHSGAVHFLSAVGH